MYSFKNTVITISYFSESKKLMSFDKLLQQSLIWRGFYFATSLLLNIVLSRFLQAEGSGFVYYLANFFSLILLIASVSMESGFTYFASSKIIHSDKLAVFGIIWIVLISVVLILFFRFWFNHFDSKSSINQFTYCQYAIFFIAGVLLNNFYTALFQAEQNFFLPNFLLGSMNMIFIIILVLEKWNGYSIHTLTDSFFYFILINGIVIAISYFIKNKILLSFSWMGYKEFKILFQYSLLALFTNVIFFLVYRIDFWFVKYNCSAADLGNYIQASKIGQLILVIPQVLASAVFPQIASGKLQADVSSVIIKLLRIFIQFFSVLFIFVFLTGHWLFIFVFGQSFDKMQQPLLILLPGILCLSALSLLSAYFGGKGDLKVNMKGAVYGLMVVVAGNVLLLKYYTIEIAAIVSSAGYIVNFAYSYRNFAKIGELKPDEFRKWTINDWLWLKRMLFNK